MNPAKALLQPFLKKTGRPFHAWQIELTTRCPLRCRMCIRSATDQWSSQDMPIEHFRKLTPHFKTVENIVLEGWGEPLLYDRLTEAVRLVKKEGSRVGFVTSGWGLDRSRSAELIRAGVDFLGFSLAGTTAGTHDGIRVNSDLTRLLQAIQNIQQFKRDNRLLTPEVHIVYLMLKDNLEEIVHLPDLAKDVGAGEVVLINLIQIADKWQEAQRVFGDRSDYGNRILRETEARAAELKIRLRKPSLVPVERAVCEENPLRNLYIAVTGEVSSCVHLCPPVPPPLARRFFGAPCLLGKVSFGNIFHHPFEDIWNRKDYRDFRDAFAMRKKRWDELCASFLWSRGNLRREQDLVWPEPPRPCKHCHKIFGL